MTILGMSIYQVLEFFLIYAFLGWCVEVVYAAVTTGTVINVSCRFSPARLRFGIPISLFIMSHPPLSFIWLILISV